MNNILQLKGRFEQRPNSSKPGSPKLPKGKSVSSLHLIQLSEQLKRILQYWKTNTDINGALVSVHYTHIVAKSNRLKILLSENSKSPAESIRGVKFIWEPDEDGKEIQKHVFTHYISLKAIENAIEVLSETISVIEKYFNGNDFLYNIIPDKTEFRRRIRENRVMIEDHFIKSERNVDYLDKDDFFSRDHLYYKEDGYLGFSDYSIIGNEYSETGFAPYAVAIHIIYFDEEKSLRVRHFVSDSNDDISDIAGKFKEAMYKLVKWNKTAKLDTYGIRKLEEFYSLESYPGLGTVKKLSIMHHLELMNSFLDGVEI